jgi:acyl carrier protein
MPALDKNSVRTDLKGFIVESFLFGNKNQTFTDSDSFMDKGIVDSTGILELTSYIEEKYGIAIKDEEMIPDNLDSINNLVGFIARKLG